MVYRVRPINWDLLVNPTVQGIGLEAQASENFARALSGAGATLGHAIAGIGARRDDRQEKKDRLALGYAELDQRKNESEMRHQDRLDALQEKQANERDNAQGVIATSDALLASESQEDAQKLQKFVAAIGGPERSSLAVQNEVNFVADAIPKTSPVKSGYGLPPSLTGEETLIGPNGVPMKSSEEAAVGAAELHARVKLISQQVNEVFRAIRTAKSHDDRMALEYRFKQLSSVGAGLAGRAAGLDRQASQAKVEEDKRASVAIQAEVQKQKDADELRQHNDFFLGKGEAPANSLLEAKQRYGAKYGAGAVSREDNQSNQRERDAVAREDRLKAQESVMAARDRTAALAERAQTFRESQAAARFTSGASKQAYKEGLDKVNVELRSANEANARARAAFDEVGKRDAALAEAKVHADRADRFMEELQKIRDGADVGVKEPAPAAPKAPASQRVADRFKALEGG